MPSCEDLIYLPAKIFVTSLFNRPATNPRWFWTGAGEPPPLSSTPGRDVRKKAKQKVEKLEEKLPPCPLR